MSVSADFSSDIFNKQLPQSSLIIDRTNSLSGARLNNAPRTLFDEIGREFNDHDDLVSITSIIFNTTFMYIYVYIYSITKICQQLFENNNKNE